MNTPTQNELFSKNEYIIFNMDSISIASLGHKTIFENPDKLDTFFADEMVDVCVLANKSLIQIFDQYGEELTKYTARGQYLQLSPCFFGKGLELHINGQHQLDLSLEYWESFVATGPLEVVH